MEYFTFVCYADIHCTLLSLQAFTDGIFSMNKPAVKKDVLEVLSCVKSQANKNDEAREKMDLRMVSLEKKVERLTKMLETALQRLPEPSAL